MSDDLDRVALRDDLTLVFLGATDDLPDDVGYGIDAVLDRLRALGKLVP